MRPVLLAHGGSTGPWQWDRVLPLLRAEGVSVTTVDLPSRTGESDLLDDEAAVRTALRSLPAPTVLVGHSYSGMVVTGASADNADVAHLVYICAALPQEGETLATVTTRRAEDHVVPPPVVDDTDPLSAFRRDVSSDADDEQWAFMRPRIGTMPQHLRTQVPSGLGWRDHPSTYVVCTADRTFPPAIQRRMAAHASQVFEVEAGHMPMMTRPEEIAQIILTVARA